MKKSNIHDAKTNLSKLVKQALAGEDVVIARNGVPLVRLVPIGTDPLSERPLGQWKGQVWIAEDFDKTSEDIIRLFEGDETAPHAELP